MVSTGRLEVNGRSATNEHLVAKEVTSIPDGGSKDESELSREGSLFAEELVLLLDTEGGLNATD